MDLITYALLSKKIASSTTGIADAVLANGTLTITSTDGASYNIELPTTDATLAQSGAPADAKAVGDAIAALGQSLASLEISDIEGLASALTSKANVSQLDALSAALATKANATTIVAMQSAISNLQQALAELGATTSLDAYPTPSSRNAVRSDGIVAYVDDLLDPIEALIAGESFTLADGTIMTAPDQSAYAAAVEGGFSGTRAQFNQLMAEGLGHTGIAIAPSTDNSDIVVLIDDQSGTTVEIPEIDDEHESEHDTWSSTKIAAEIAGASAGSPNWLAAEGEEGHITNMPGSPTTVLGVRENVTTEVYDYTHITDHINGTISATVAEVTSPTAEKVRVTINGHKYIAEFIKSQSGYTYYGYNHNSSWGLVDDTDIGIQVFFSNDGTENEVNVSVSENCTIDWVNAIEDTSDVTISIEMLDMIPGYVPAADWAENDPSKSTYIANKPYEININLETSQLYEFMDDSMVTFTEEQFVNFDNKNAPQKINFKGAMMGNFVQGGVSLVGSEGDNYYTIHHYGGVANYNNNTVYFLVDVSYDDNDFYEALLYMNNSAPNWEAEEGELGYIANKPDIAALEARIAALEAQLSNS